jgi:4-amino-4-deoxy-L-arabinose transferase-like glycosyltransferase
MNSDTAGRQPKRFVRYLTVIILIWVFFAQLVFGARHLSMTSDELPHAINGYAILATGDAWSVPRHGHPPLVNAWSALPLFLQPERPDPRAVPYWGKNLIQFTRAMWPLLGPIERLAFVIRYPIMLLAVVLMALVYRWTYDWFGHWGGVLAIAVMACDPTLIAHSQLNTTDIGMTLFAFACLYLTARLLRRSGKSWRLLAGIGVLLGATMAAKATGLLLVPAVWVMLGWGYVRETGYKWRRLLRKQSSPDVSLLALLRASGRWLGYCAFVLVTGGMVLWATYLFEWRALPGMSRPLPLASHLRMLQIILEERGRTSFLWGQLKQGGWWWYFPFAFAIKTPIPLIIGLVAAVVVAVRRGWRLAWEEMVLWFFPLFYMATAIQSELNIGYRHLLPAFPFAYVGIGRLARWLLQPWQSRWRWIVRSVAAALGVWYVVGTLGVYPFALAYFNEFVGGPRNGYHYLVDSNVDWGQSFKALKAYMDEAGIDQVWLSYFTWVDPALYGVRYQPLFPGAGSKPVLPRRYDPAPGVYAISATTLQGVALREHDPDLYDWFRHQTPVAQPGYGLLVYRVLPRDPPAQWLAQCTAPEAPLSPEAVLQGLGRDDLRLVYFDCTQSWIYPGGGRSPGWYGFPRETWLKGDHFLRQSLSPAHLNYQQVEADLEPPLTLFEWNGTETLPLAGARLEARAAPPDWTPPRVEAETRPLTSPIALGGPLTFLGYRVLSTSSDKSVELETVWRVEATPNRPLSIMAHLVNTNGAPIAVGDGVGMPVDQWQVGDIVIQRHRLEIPAGTQPGSYWLQTGVYWLDTLARWPVEQDGNSIGDRLLLAPLKVK